MDLAKELRGDMFLISNAMRKIQVCKVFCTHYLEVVLKLLTYADKLHV